METKQNFPVRASYGKVLVASLFILSGILLFARNMGWITHEMFSILVSWQSLIIIIGIYALTHRHYVGGGILLLTGAYFLMGRLSWVPYNLQALIWPLALILCGVLFLQKGHKRGRRYRQHIKERIYTGTSFQTAADGSRSESGNGFLHSNNTFGAARHIVLDDPFTGANIHTYFGGTTIDLRHTHLVPGETYIDLDCSCGGIELFIPADWKVIIKCRAFFGGCEDKRWQGAMPLQESVLVIRGNISFGGLEIKD